MQFFSLCLHNNCDFMLDVLTQLPFGLDLFKSTLSGVRLLTREYQIVRVVIGISAVLKNPNKNQAILAFIPDIMASLYHAIYKVMEMRFELRVVGEKEEWDAEPEEYEDASKVNYWVEEKRRSRSNLDQIDVADVVLRAWKQIQEDEPKVEEMIRGCFPKVEELLRNCEGCKQMFEHSRRSKREREREEMEEEGEGEMESKR